MDNTRKSTLILDFDLLAASLKVSFFKTSFNQYIIIVTESEPFVSFSNPILSESSFHSCGTAVTSLENFKDFKEYLLWSFSGEQINSRTRLFLWCRDDEKSAESALVCVQRQLRRSEGGAERPRYWVTKRSARTFTFPLIALHLQNHVKLACVLAPYSVLSQSHTHSQWASLHETHTHTQLL